MELIDIVTKQKKKDVPNPGITSLILKTFPCITAEAGAHVSNPLVQPPTVAFIRASSRVATLPYLVCAQSSLLLLLSYPHCCLVVVLVSTTSLQMLTTFVLNLEHMLQNQMDGVYVAWNFAYGTN